MASPLGRGRAVAVVLVVAALPIAAAGPSSARPRAPSIAVLPAGTTTIVEDAAWSWFEDERAQLSADGSALYTSAVAGPQAQQHDPGTVLLSEVRLATGSRRMVELGHAESDDHNSASIWEAPTGELTTSWSRHTVDSAIRTQRRRTDGSWLRLPSVQVSGTTAYSSLISSTGAAGQDLLYDFYRGERFDPSVLVSADVGRTWSSLGRVLRDPADSASGRPYVQYANDGHGRIDLIATETHPRDSQTSVYHGYIEQGQVFSSTGTLLGPLGSTLPVTALTLVWAPSGEERAWVSGIEHDPATGQPVIAFSVRHSVTDHRYWYGRWDGAAWQTAEVAYAGRALYAAEADYTGLAAVDPIDPNHLVISTDAHPASGLPLLSSTDGLRHWELWDGRRAGNGSWSWTALTTDSTMDNLRPVLTSAGGAQAMLWMRGRYTSYTSYDADIVGVVRTPADTTVAAGPPQATSAVDVLAVPAPRAEQGAPVVGGFDGHPADDLFLVRAGSAPEALLLGDDQRHATPIAPRSVVGAYTPIAGDYDGNGTTDIYFYAPGPAADSLWLSSDIGQFTSTSVRQVIGAYTPIPGDYDGNGTTDIYWYAPGAATDSLWTAAGGAFTPRTTRQAKGTYRPSGGDHDADGYDDIFWYAPGATTDSRWRGGPGAALTATTTRQVMGTYTPVSGDYDGNGRTDILWYAPGATTDRLWLASGTGAFTDAAVRPVVRSYVPIVGDFDGDGRDDVQWYAPGTVADRLWWSAAGPLADDEPAAVNL